MLYKGQFIKEAPPKIGVYYIKPLPNYMTEEALVVQSWLLDEPYTLFDLLADIFHRRPA